MKLAGQVLIDVNPLLKPHITGVGVYTGEIVRYLCSSQRDDLRCGFYYSSHRRGDVHHLSSRIADHKIQEAFNNGLAYYGGMEREYGRFASKWVDLQSWIGLANGSWRVFHATNILLPPLPPNVKGIVTIHDLLFSRFPHFESVYWQRRWKMRVAQALRRADCIIAISEATARDVEHFFGIDPGKIRVIYQGVSDDKVQWIHPSAKQALRERWNLPQRFLLFVGTLSTHKNVMNLLKAFLKINDPELGFVIVGKPGDNSAEIQEFVEKSPARARIHLHGYVDHAHLESLYQLATL
ncbi:MAG TPA: glycosyltransferase family 1 protein, partial [Acidobacteriaceae bacterium]|nr:glycosyltransferase family 1 protein [Acidobacteriaceae bacterium]